MKAAGLQQQVRKKSNRQEIELVVKLLTKVLAMGEIMGIAKESNKTKHKSEADEIFLKGAKGNRVS